MRHDFLDKYSRLKSPIHSFSAEAKMIAAILLVLLVIMIPAAYAPVLAGVGLLLAVIAALSRIPFGFLLRRLLLLEPLVIGVALLNLFQPEGWRTFGLLLARSNLCLLTMILLSNTTPFPAILRVLGVMRFPRILVTVLALMYRYLFVLVDEAERLQRARVSRTFSTGRCLQWSLYSIMIGQLFVRSTERAERIFMAMRARGWR
jgi:cobalt/nickel transport system permease protein